MHGDLQFRGRIRDIYKDPEIGIEWPLDDVLVSGKDAKAQSLKQWLASPLSDNIVYQPKLAFLRE